MDVLKKLIHKFHRLFEYLFYSVLSTILDVAIVWALYNKAGLNITLANTIGVVAGFLLGYVLASKRVFEANYSMPSFLIYFGTFLGGLVLADVLITVTHRSLITSCPEWFAFLVSKGVSVVVPFFAMYFARKVLYAQLRRKERKDAHE